MAQIQLTHKLCRSAGIIGMTGVLFGCGSDLASSQSKAVTVVSAAPIPASTSATTPGATSGTVTLPQVVVTGVVVQAGDSIGAGLGANDWAAIDHMGFSPGIVIRNVSVSGKSMQTGYGYRVNELFPFRNATAPSVLLIQQGTNDLYYGTSASSLYRGIATPFISEAKKAGFYVVIDTILPRTDSGWTPAMERERIAYNLLVRGNRAGADAVNDLAADEMMGDGSLAVNAAFYADGAHPSLIGQQRLAVLNATIIGPFLNRPARTPSR